MAGLLPRIATLVCRDVCKLAPVANARALRLCEGFCSGRLGWGVFKEKFVVIPLTMGTCLPAAAAATASAATSAAADGASGNCCF